MANFSLNLHFYGRGLQMMTFEVKIRGLIYVSATSKMCACVLLR